MPSRARIGHGVCTYTSWYQCKLTEGSISNGLYSWRMQHPQIPSDINKATLVVAYLISCILCTSLSIWVVWTGCIGRFVVGCAHHLAIISLFFPTSPLFCTWWQAYVECGMPSSDAAYIFLSRRCPWIARIGRGLCISLNHHQVWTTHISHCLQL